MEESPGTKRTVSADPGLMSPEQLLAAHKGGRRRTLEQLIAKHNQLKLSEETTCLTEARQKTKWFLDHARIKISYDDFMMFVTLFVLFGDDIRLISFPPSSDGAFSILNSIAFFLFLTEMFLNCWAKSDFSKGIRNVKGYMFSFFFWLDLLAVVSMVPDIDWLASTIGINILPGKGVGAKVGKAGKIGAKTGRVVRMARLVRLVKLYKITSQRRRERKMLDDLQKLVDMGQLEPEDTAGFVEKMTYHKQSKVGAELSDIITRRVIIAVLLMLCVVPLLSYSSSGEDEKVATSFLHAVNINAGYGPNATCEYLRRSTFEFVDFMGDVVDSDADTNSDHKYLLGLEITPSRCNSTTDLDFMDLDILENIREDSVASIQTNATTVDGIDYSVLAVFNLSSFIQDQALAGIYLTLFVVFMLISLSTQFTGDAQKLVLAPIESMMEMVNMVADDPLEDFNFHHFSKGSGDYETRVVQVAIQKITALLRVGFGVAGADIISTNMAVEGEGSAVLEPMLPGKRVYAIFGFCDIHAFDLCTEKLEDEIMTFVNSVARIVHEEVTRWGGLCNKNLGNAFLMVWRIGDEAELQFISGRRRRASQRGSVTTPSRLASPMRGTNNLSVDLRRIPGLDTMSDKALVGFLKVVVEVNRDRQVLAYRADRRLSQRGPTMVSDFKLRMGFGLHAGWAIEGAVGSLQKVDATYLSPHVNMAARMEAASRQFGVSILMTERFHELMSPDAQEVCRKIDVVTVKGSAVPMPIYTYDTFQDQVFPELQTPKFSSLTLSEVLDQQAEEYDSETLWKTDQDLLQLRRLSTPVFNEVFEEGIESYLSGNWSRARKKLEEASNIVRTNGNPRGDGPSQTIMNYMKARDWTCPDGWKGYRPLTSK